jgi:spermidine/putrescine-binding protein
MKLVRHIAAVALALALGVTAAAAQQRSDITLKVASFAGPFGEALQKYAFDLYTKRTGIKVEVQYANPADSLPR